MLHNVVFIDREEETAFLEEAMRFFPYLIHITDRMALIDLSDICAKNIFERIGKTGRNIEYILSRNKPEKPEINQK
jgi:hypothetical protein